MIDSSLYNQLADAFSHFNLPGSVCSIERFGSGHINDTYRVTTSEKDLPGYILQRINERVFKNVHLLMENIENVTNHLSKKLRDIPGNISTGESLRLLLADDEKPYFKDSSGNYWRVFLFVMDSVIFQKAINSEQAYEAGRAIGEFQYLLTDYHGVIHETIPGFHNLDKRLMEFDQAIKSASNKRIQKAENEASFVERKKDQMREMIADLKLKNVTLRIIHNDTKLNNILFDKQGCALCLIDFDTVMKGYIHYDFGDAIRILANNADEDEPDIQQVSFNFDYYKSFSIGYLEQTNSFLSPAEKKWLAFAPFYMTFIIGLRFLTDYLNGDTYFKINREDHNLQRARVQFRLISLMEVKYDSMREVLQ